MNAQQAMRPHNHLRKCETNNRDEREQVVPRTFPYSDLPTEIQVLTLIKAVVSRRLSGKTFGDVYDALAPVSQLWRAVISAPWF